MEFDDDIIAAAIMAAAELTELALEEEDEITTEGINETFRAMYENVMLTVLEVTPEFVEEDDDEEEEEGEEEEIEDDETEE